MSNSPEANALARLVRDGRRYWATPTGQAVRQAERACLGPVCERVFGAHSLELGMGACLADMCPVRHPMRWAPTRELAEQSATLVSPPDALPLPDDCLSLVVIHHLLEVVPDPHHMLQESARVTAHDGRLIIFGWMPIGAGGLARAWPGRRRRVPWRGHWRTPGRLKDWLAFVDFEIERVDYCSFHLPGSVPRNTLLETLGRRYNLPLGDSYMIQARRKPQLAQTQPPRLAFTRPFGGAALGATRLRQSPEPERMLEVD
ncbi:class I SAM-dependent methyltransferase [Halomonas urumqiensis]|uniref:Methyltransferase type 11 n=1 Tax=Halomonas urumqiensis TaxID=1684789 RepID=A0A2N7UEL0_9GAMM|nr:methyltransferase domain-containing protein [Halomonas urumqiensis]PMR78867.1 methyltransferase type 11 [Halomonas urumqiensis]PTB04227.1 methyltransferase domain-containing protein [Halomonas urumqiensis]GHE19498.1 SAM-dependent methyltransferase [Halomonas urumqiensis]